MESNAAEAKEEPCRHCPLCRDSSKVTSQEGLTILVVLSLVPVASNDGSWTVVSTNTTPKKAVQVAELLADLDISTSDLSDPDKNESLDDLDMMSLKSLETVPTMADVDEVSEMKSTNNTLKKVGSISRVDR